MRFIIDTPHRTARRSPQQRHPFQQPAFPFCHDRSQGFISRQWQRTAPVGGMKISGHAVGVGSF